MTPDFNDDTSQLHFDKYSSAVHDCLNDISFLSKPEIFVPGIINIGSGQKNTMWRERDRADRCDVRKGKKVDLDLVLGAINRNIFLQPQRLAFFGHNYYFKHVWEDTCVSSVICTRPGQFMWCLVSKDDLY